MFGKKKYSLSGKSKIINPIQIKPVFEDKEKKKFRFFQK